MEKLKFRDIIKVPLDFKINNEVSHQPSDFFDNKPYYKVDFDVKLSDGKNLQRDFVWSLDQKRELILSIIKGIPLPRFAAVCFTDDTKNRQEQHKVFKIIDGKQRLSTVRDFMENKFCIFVDNKAYYYDDFDQELQRSIWGCDLRFNIVYEYPDTKLTDKQLITWFELINFAGTIQDKQHLKNLKDE